MKRFYFLTLFNKYQHLYPLWIFYRILFNIISDRIFRVVINVCVICVKYTEIKPWTNSRRHNILSNNSNVIQNLFSGFYKRSLRIFHYIFVLKVVVWYLYMNTWNGLSIVFFVNDIWLRFNKQSDLPLLMFFIC